MADYPFKEPVGIILTSLFHPRDSYLLFKQYFKRFFSPQNSLTMLYLRSERFVRIKPANLLNKGAPRHPVCVV